jgi:hypothetical protein
VSDVTESAKREVDATRQSVKDAKEQLSVAMRSAGGPPAENEDQAASQIESIRGQLDRDLDVLRTRVPDPQDLLARYGDRIRSVAVPVVGGAATLAATVRLGKRRASRRRQAVLIREQAAAIAHELARLDYEDLAGEEVRERGGRGRLLLLVLAAGAAGAAVWRRQAAQHELDAELWDPPTSPASRSDDFTGEPVQVIDVTTPEDATSRLAASDPTEPVPPIPRVDPVPPPAP